MPGNSGGDSGSGCGSALIVGLALGAIFTWLLMNSNNASVTTAASPSQGISGPVGTSTPPINDGSSLVAFQITPTPARSVVHVFGTPQTTSLNPNLSPTPTCSNGQSISAWVPGYYILTFRCIDNPTSRYDVGLEAVPTGLPVMNETLGTSSAISCYGCHNGSLSPSINEYDDWIKDGHSKVFTAPYFRTTYLGTDINGRQSQQIQWNILPSGQQIYPLIDVMQPDYGGGYQLDYPVRNGNCAVCHVPAGFPETLQEANLANLINSSRGTFINAAAEGITCDICHKVTDVLVEKNSKLPYDDRPGILSMSMARSNLNQQLTFGPLAYQSVLDPPNINVNIKRACYPVYSESKFCAACHYGKFANTLIYGSYKEWLDSNYSKKGTASYRTCQDCHMSGEAQSGHPHLAEHDACSAANPELQNFNHNMMNNGQDPDNLSRTIPLLVKDAAQIRLEPVLTGGQIQIKVTVQSVGVGHKFPTDSPLRHLILLIDARDWRNNRLVQSGGPRVPVWAVPDYGGYPGQIFANILKDKDTNLAPTFAYWNPVEAAWDGADTRLVPGVPVQNVYSFAAPYENSAKITAKLIYRRAFKNVVDEKSWPMENVDVQVTQTVMDCNGFGADPQTITCNVVTPTPTPTPTASP